MKTMMHSPSPSAGSMSDNVPESGLLPCPFCGGRASYDRVGTARQSCIISCDSCGCTLETGEVWSCGQRWNQRHLGAVTRDDIEEPLP